MSKKFTEEKKTVKNPQLEEELNYHDSDHAIAHGYDSANKLRMFSTVN